MTGYPLAYAAISLITLFLLFVMPAGGLDSPYVQWGWRIPFVIGALLAFAFVIYYVALRGRVGGVGRDRRQSEAPLKALFSGMNL